MVQGSRYTVKGKGKAKSRAPVAGWRVAPSARNRVVTISSEGAFFYSIKISRSNKNLILLRDLRVSVVKETEIMSRKGKVIRSDPADV